MSINITTPVTGGAQTGFTSPTYTVTADVAPDINGKQVAVTALGGTQTGVTLHSVASPFTGTVVRPKQLRVLGVPSGNGYISSVPTNTYKVITRKGVTPAVNQPARIMPIMTTIDVPAGADTYDSANVRAAIALHIGLLNQLSAGLGDTVVNGLL